MIKKKNSYYRKAKPLAIFHLFTRYFIRNKGSWVSLALTLVVDILLLSRYIQLIAKNESVNGAAVLFYIFVIQAISLIPGFFATILFDFKQSVIYQRIGLVRISPWKFIFNILLLMFLIWLISGFIVFIVFIIAIAIINYKCLTTIFDWHLLPMVLLIISIVLIISALTFFLATKIRNRNLMNTVFILMSLSIIPIILFSNSLINSLSGVRSQIASVNFWIFFVLINIIINALSFLFIWLSKKFFYWSE